MSGRGVASRNRIRRLVPRRIVPQVISFRSHNEHARNSTGVRAELVLGQGGSHSLSMPGNVPWCASLLHVSWAQTCSGGRIGVVMGASWGGACSAGDAGPAGSVCTVLLLQTGTRWGYPTQSTTYPQRVYAVSPVWTGLCPQNLESPVVGRSPFCDHHHRVDHHPGAGVVPSETADQVLVCSLVASRCFGDVVPGQGPGDMNAVLFWGYPLPP